jgi:hypothetical protein
MGKMIEAKPINKIKDSTRAVQKSLVNAALNSIWGLAVTAAPFLNWPVISQVSRFVLEKAIHWLTESGIIWFNIGWIRVNLGEEWSQVENKRQLLIMAQDQGASDEELDDIESDLIKAFEKAWRIGRAPL